MLNSLPLMENRFEILQVIDGPAPEATSIDSHQSP